MKQMSRRGFLGAAASSPFIGCRSSRKPAGIRVREITHDYEDYLYRTPIKFGGTVLNRATILNVNCLIEAPNGRTAKGFGSMPLGNVWSFPSKAISYDGTLSAMKALAARNEKITAAYAETGHPIDINQALEPEYVKAAGEVSRQLALAEPIPKLCMLVTASPFDAAIHDAFGKLHSLNCYLTYGPEFIGYDLSHYLDADLCTGSVLGRSFATTAWPDS